MYSGMPSAPSIHYNCLNSIRPVAAGLFMGLCRAFERQPEFSSE